MGFLNYPSANVARDAAGSPVPGAQRYIYLAGKDTLTSVFRDSGLTVTQANPMKADANGEFDLCYLLEGDYRVEVKSKDGKVLVSHDNIAVRRQIQQSTGHVFPSVKEVRDDDLLSYTPRPGRVVVNEGELIHAEDSGCSYKVAGKSATGHHLETGGGVKICAVPSIQGRVTTAQLGWVSGTDVTEDLTAFLASDLTGISALVFTGNFQMQGGGYTIPEGLKAFLSDDYDDLNHGEQATRGLSFMDRTHESAAANGLDWVQTKVFDTPSGFKVGGLLLDHNVDVDASQLISGGNASEIFNCTDQAVGLEVDKCRFAFEGGIGIEIAGSPYWKFTNNYAGKQKYLLVLLGGSHHGLYEGNRGRMGFVGLNASGTAPTIYGDFIKTTAKKNVGARHCRVRRNHFKNKHRDGPDGTGGFGYWVFDSNHFEVAVAGIDIKLAYNDSNDMAKQEAQYSGIRITNNTFDGCGIVYSGTRDDNATGQVVPDFRQLRGITSRGNMFRPRPGKNITAHFVKSVNYILSDGDTVETFRGLNAGPWDASTGTFPTGEVLKHSYYTVSVAGTVDGESFDVGDILYALKPDPASDRYPGEWFNNGDNPFVAMNFVKFDDLGMGMSNQGNWDASAGTFPSGSDLSDYWKVSVAGTVDGIAFEVGDYLAPLVAEASTTDYEGNWQRRSIRGYINKGMTFENLSWDSRGGQDVTLGTCEDVSVHFRHWLHDGTSSLSVSCDKARISGKIRSIANPQGSTVDVLYLKNCRDVKIDVDCSHELGASDAGALVRVSNGMSSDVWIDGKILGLNELIDNAGSGDIEGWHLGKRSGLTLCDVTKVINNAGSSVGLYAGEVDWGVAMLWSNSEPDNHALGKLKTGLGPELTLDGGEVDATCSIHRIDTESDAASDDLVTINGGSLGDRLMIVAADDARTVVAKDGSGNLVLGADRTLDSTAETLVLEKRGDGNWHQLG